MTNLPNLRDGRDGADLYEYSRNADGSIHVRARFASLGDGIGAGGKRFLTVEAAAAAVRAAREIVAARWSKPTRTVHSRLYGTVRGRDAIPFTLIGD